MESMERGKAALISGIEADARAEEERLIGEAENQVAEKKKYARKKAESLLDGARKKAMAQAAAIKQKAISAADREVKRRALHTRETLMRDIVERAQKKLGSMIGDASYRMTLTNWVAEAALGLGADAAVISASAQELPLIDDQLLADVAECVKARSGKSITLTVSDAEPLEFQGVVLTTADGRMAFNNQVRTRVSRKRREIQMLIYNAVFAGSQEE